MKGRPFSPEHRLALSRAWKRTPEQLQAHRMKTAQTSKGRINIKRYICISPDGVEHVTERGLTHFCEQHTLQAVPV